MQVRDGKVSSFSFLHPGELSIVGSRRVEGKGVKNVKKGGILEGNGQKMESVRLSFGKSSPLDENEEALTIDDCISRYKCLVSSGATPPNSLLSCLRGAKFVFPKAPPRPVSLCNCVM